MINIIAEKTIAAPMDQVSAAFDDFANVYKFHPAVQRSGTTNGQTSGVGAERVCHFYDGSTFHERLAEVSDGRWVVDVKQSGPIRKAQAIITAVPEGPGRTRVKYDMRLTIGFPMNLMAPMIRMRFRRILLKVFDGLEDHLRTGRLIEKDGEIGRPIEIAGLRAAAA